MYKRILALLIAMTALFTCICFPDITVSAEGIVIYEENFESGSFTTISGMNGSNYTRTIYKDGVPQWTLEKNGGEDFSKDYYPADANLVGSNFGNDTTNLTGQLNTYPGRLADDSARKSENVMAWHNLVSDAKNKYTEGKLTIDIRMQISGSYSTSKNGTSLLLFENPLDGYDSSASKVFQFRLALGSSSTARRMRIPYEYLDDSTVAGYDHDLNTAKSESGTNIAPALNSWIYMRAVADIDSKTITVSQSTTTRDALTIYSPKKSTFNFFGNGSKRNIPDTNGPSGTFTMADGISAIGFCGTGGLAIDDIKITYEGNGPKAPVANNITITGDPLTGNFLTGTYGTYEDQNGDVESGSTYEWIRADNAAFTEGVETVASGNITAGETSKYNLTDADVGKYIKFSVTPRNNADEKNVGETVSAVLPLPVRKPQTKPIVTLTSPANGARIKQGATINLTAEAVCDNAAITKIEYHALNYEGVESIIAESSEAPFTATWTSDQPEDYGIFARAFNNLGESGDSEVSNISIFYQDPNIDPETGADILYQEDFESGIFTIQNETDASGYHYRHLYKDGRLQWTFAKDAEEFSETFPSAIEQFILNDTGNDGSNYLTVGGKQPDKIKVWHNLDKTISDGIVHFNIRLRPNSISDANYPLSVSMYDEPFTDYASSPKKVFELRFTRVSSGQRMRYPYYWMSTTSRAGLDGVTTSHNPADGKWIDFQIGINLNTQKVDIMIRPAGQENFVPYNESKAGYQLEFYGNGTKAPFTRATKIAALAFDGNSNGMMKPFSQYDLSFDDIKITHESNVITLYKEDGESVFDGILAGNSKVIAKTIVKNNAANPVGLNLKIAAYDEDDNLLRISSGSISNISADEVGNLEAELPITSDLQASAAKLKTFLWNADSTPYTESIETPLSVDLIGDKQLDIFIHIGQSNMSGRADISSSEKGAIERSYLFNNDKRWSVASQPMNKYSILGDTSAQIKMGPSYTFATTLAANLPDTCFGHIVNAKGGSSITAWQKGGFYYDNTMEKAKEAQKYGKVKGIIWHQGSSDTGRLDVYLDYLNQMVTDMRKDLGDPNIPFIAGELMPSTEPRIAWNNMIHGISERVSDSAWVSADGLSCFDVTTHFDTKSQRILGQRYAKAMLKMAYNIEIDAP